VSRRERTTSRQATPEESAGCRDGKRVREGLPGRNPVRMICGRRPPGEFTRHISCPPASLSHSRARRRSSSNGSFQPGRINGRCSHGYALQVVLMLRSASRNHPPELSRLPPCPAISEKHRPSAIVSSATRFCSGSCKYGRSVTVTYVVALTIARSRSWIWKKNSSIAR
jgi:hypothetical protein